MVLFKANVYVCLRRKRERKKFESDFCRIPESSGVTLDCSVFLGKKSVPEVALGGQNATFSLHLVVCGLVVLNFYFSNELPILKTWRFHIKFQVFRFSRKQKLRSGYTWVLNSPW